MSYSYHAQHVFAMYTCTIGQVHLLVSLYKQMLSPSAWGDQRSHQGDIIVINLLIIISPCQKPLRLQF